jgi:hypothetical protein
VLARADLSDEADEGLTGYRCAVARNEEADCDAAVPFVQRAAFLPGPEDDINSECDEICVNPTFKQLRRVAWTDKTRVLRGAEAQLAFWVVGTQLQGEFVGIDGEHVLARAQDATFSDGTTGLSVLNVATSFADLKVCQAFGMPD